MRCEKCGRELEATTGGWLSCRGCGYLMTVDKRRENRKRVYVAGALTRTRERGEVDSRPPGKVVEDYISNVGKMYRAGAYLIKKGFAPYVPAADIIMGIAGGDISEEEYRSLGMAWLEACDAVLVLSWSEGVEAEVKRAGELGIPVFERVEDLLRWRDKHEE